MRNELTKETNKYRLTFFIRYMGDALIYPFLALYLRSINFSNDQAGLILMILPLVSIFINPLWSFFSKNVNQNRWFASILTLLEALSIILLINVGAKLSLILLSVFLIAVFGQPFYNILDSFTVVYSEKNNIKYSKLRIFGSISYAVTSIFSGFLTRYSYTIAFYVAAFFFILTTFLLLWLKPIKLDDTIKTKELKEDVYKPINKRVNISGKRSIYKLASQDEDKPSIKSLFRNKAYIKFAIFIVFTLTLMFAIDTYLPLFLKDSYGLDEVGYSWMFSACVFAEIIVLFILNRIKKKINLRNLLIVMASTLTIRFLVFGISDFVGVPLGVIIALMIMLRSTTMAISIYTMMIILLRLVSPKNVTNATIFLGSFRALVQTILVYAGGHMTDKVGYSWWYLLGFGLSLIAFMTIDYKNKDY